MDRVAILQGVRRYADELLSRAAQTDWPALARIIEVLLNAKARGARVFTAGNGGSAATASHMGNDFLKGCRAHNRAGFDIECLADSNAVVTCLANDFRYEEIFSIPLRTKAKSGDVLVVFSGSGNSQNLVEAAKAAREMGAITIGFLGRDGGALKPLSDYCLIAPSDTMEQIEDMHMFYEHIMASVVRAELEDEWGMEIVDYPRKGAKFGYALFDFDGTLSLIREGWQEIMIPYFIEVLSRAPGAEDEKTVREIVTAFVDKLTGKQTIFQCIRLNDEVVARGGAEVDPGVYKAEYLRRLGLKIASRLEALRGGADPAEYIVPGGVELLKRLRAEGFRLYLASGTDETDVMEEARLLKIDKYFDGGIYGARDNILACSKEIVIKDIIEKNHLTGAELLSFGDGFVEIELIAGIGGYAVGVATDEVRKKGVNARKRARLIEAGASMIIPDFERADELVDFIMGGK